MNKKDSQNELLPEIRAALLYRAMFFKGWGRSLSEAISREFVRNGDEVKLEIKTVTTQAMLEDKRKRTEVTLGQYELSPARLFESSQVFQQGYLAGLTHMLEYFRLISQGKPLNVNLPGTSRAYENIGFILSHQTHFSLGRAGALSFAAESVQPNLEFLHHEVQDVEVTLATSVKSMALGTSTRFALEGHRIGLMDATETVTSILEGKKLPLIADSASATDNYR